MPDRRFRATGASFVSRDDRPALAATATLGMHGVRFVIRFGTVAVLARLIAPEAFGLVAIAVALLAVLEFARDDFFSAPVFRQREVTHDQASDLFWMTVAASAAICLAIVVMAPAVAHVFERPELSALAIALGSGLLVGGVAVQHLAFLQRRERFVALAAAETGAAAAGTVAAVIAALMDAGVWALVVQRLVATASLALSAWALCRWRPSAPRAGTPAGAFEWPDRATTGSGLAEVLARTLDRIVIGLGWGALSVGLYDRAARLVVRSPHSRHSPYLALTASALGRLRGHPRDFRQAGLGIVETVGMIALPAAAVVAVVPDWIVAVVLGERWLDAAPILMWFAIAAAAVPVADAVGWLLSGQSRSADAARCRLAGAGIRIAAVVAGLPFGPEGIAASIALSELVVRLPLQIWMTGRAGPVSAADLFVALLPSAIVAGLVFVVTSTVRRLPEYASSADPEGLGTAILLAVVTTVVGVVGLPSGRRMLGDRGRLRALLGHPRGVPS